ncbi:MAG TPA: Stf0 family sulfotransferase [Acidimicrobiia bacterium]|jgi:LPS sulfotransferase NodH
MKTIFICTIPRTGSSLLSADMRTTVALGEPREYFNPNRMGRLIERWQLEAGDLDAYVTEMKKRTASPNGIIAVKIMVSQLIRLEREGLLRPEGKGRLRALAAKFGTEDDTLVIQLLRRDKLRQAISLMKARQTGQWGVLRKALRKPTYDREEVAGIIVELVVWETQWQREFAASGLQPAIDLVYEDLPSRRDETLLAIARNLDLPDPEGIVANRARDEVQLERQADETTEAWINDFAMIT